ncbi:MAG: phage tail tape measure protein, partial [Pseudomonadota bacterium]
RGGRTGLMGEAGPEAIMPLSRGPDGRLGVRAEGGGASPSVTVNIQTADIESFRRSRGQVAAGIARAVGLGARRL